MPSSILFSYTAFTVNIQSHLIEAIAAICSQFVLNLFGNLSLFFSLILEFYFQPHLILIIYLFLFFVVVSFIQIDALRGLPKAAVIHYNWPGISGLCALYLKIISFWHRLARLQNLFCPLLVWLLLLLLLSFPSGVCDALNLIKMQLHIRKLASQKFFFLEIS